MRSVSFNVVAPFYDRLAALIFGDEITRAQIHFLKQLEDAKSVLVLGGGSGLALKDFISSVESKIIYVDSSERMIALAKKNLASSLHRIHFICGTEANIPNETFDAVVMNFFLDMFPEEEFDTVVHRIKEKLSQNSKVIVTDFVTTNKLFHKALLVLMYRFFSLTCYIKATRLPEWNLKLQRAGLIQLNCRAFFNGFIETAVYKPA